VIDELEPRYVRIIVNADTAAFFRWREQAPVLIRAHVAQGRIGDARELVDCVLIAALGGRVVGAGGGVGSRFRHAPILTRACTCSPGAALAPILIPQTRRSVAMKRTGSARWQRGLKDGRGWVSTQSGVLSDSPYGFGTRFEQAPGTNPEELIAAAHASCFSMALSAQLGEAGLVADEIATQASVTLDKADGGFAITAVHLDVRAKIPGADESAFDKAVQAAKTGCPVSKVLNAKITMDAKLET
jgi:osmotically inducible protein OsmC